MPVEAYYRPGSLEEALELTDEHRSSLEVVSGGTLAMPAVNEGRAMPERVLDLRELGLDAVDDGDDGTVIGATVTLTEVIDRVDVPMLREAARHSGGWAVRNTATVGGNLFAPPPLGDVAVALLALEAELEVRSRDGERTVPVDEFHAGPGETVLDPDELVTEIRVPPVRGETAYRKFTRSQEPAPPIVTVAANVVRENGTVAAARIGLNGAGPHPVRAREAEAVLEGNELDDATIEEAAAAAAEDADPPTDALATEWYRRKMIEEQLSAALTEIENGNALEEGSR